MAGDSSWWREYDDLDDEQQKVFALDPDDSFLVLGPPGSGKTNLLLLRAQYLTAKGRTNVAVLTFTAMLREFVMRGSPVYNFNEKKVMTILGWQDAILRKHGIEVDRDLKFDDKRRELAAQLKGLFDKKPGLEKTFDCILVDEVQDCTPDEIELFFRAGKTVFFVGDERQQIHHTIQVISQLKTRLKTRELKLHYRNGVKICEVADEVGVQMGEPRMVGTCNYKEANAPSSAEFIETRDANDQFEKLCARLKLQLAAYPEELLGVAVPLRADTDALAQRFRSSELADQVANESEPFDVFRPDARIIVTTIHSAKGLEFRTMHLPFIQAVSRHGPREMKVSYTGITRAKTSLSVYWFGDLPPHLEPSREVTLGPRGYVEPSSLFPGKKKL